MRESFEQTLERINTAVFIADYKILSNTELQIKYKLTESKFFELCHYLNLARKCKAVSPIERLQSININEFTEVVTKFGNNVAAKRFNLSRGQVAYLNKFLGIKLTKTYEEFKNSINLDKFIEYVKTGGTDYTNFLNTKNNRFINRLLAEYDLLKSNSLEKFESSVDIKEFCLDYNKISYANLAKKYNVSIQLIKKLANKLNLQRDPHLKAKLLKQSMTDNAIALSITYDAYKTTAANKANKSKYINGTSNISKIEAFTMDKLATKTLVKSQYSSIVYPYACDIYLPVFNIYIEVNAHWTHGYHPYDEKNDVDIKQLNYIKLKQATYVNHKGKTVKNSYFTAERVWTIKDPQKLSTALDNNLKYIRIYMTRDHKLTIYFLNMLDKEIQEFKNIFNEIYTDSDYFIEKIIV